MSGIILAPYIPASLQECLWAGAVKVKFKKVDGTERVMICTLKRDLIPEDQLPKGDSPKKSNDDVLPVFDIENNGWRSFRKDSVVTYQVWQ
jgi:hypothetical protein